MNIEGTEMKSLSAIIIAALIMLSAFVIGTPAYAESENFTKRMDRMVDTLGLSGEQELKFVEVMEAQHEQQKAAKEYTRTQLADVLTKDQLAKFDEMSAKKAAGDEKKCKRGGGRRNRS